MSISPLFLVIVGFVALVYVGSWTHSWWTRKKQRKAWRTFADKFDLTFETDFELIGLVPKTTMWGLWRDRRVRMWVRKQRRNKTVYYYTVFMVELNDECWKDVTIETPDIGDAFAMHFGGEDHKLDDPGFDDDFRITGEVDERHETIFRDERIRQVLYGLVDDYSDFQISDGMIQVQRKERFTQPGDISRHLGRIVDAAEAIDAATRSPDPATSEQHEEPPSGDALFPDPDEDETPEPVW